MMLSLTYGTVPPRETFERAFQRECPDGVFCVRNVPGIPDRTLTLETAWQAVQQGCAETASYHETDFAGALLYVLGIEWV